MSNQKRTTEPGPFRAAHLRPGDRWEISEGRPIECAPTGADGARTAAAGARALATDPDVDSAGLDAGFAPEENMLRAPDVAIGNVPDEGGWNVGVPPLAVEYAGHGQDEVDLRKKITEFLSRGSRWIRVVRLNTPRRVEVHAPGVPMVTMHDGQVLEAPGILRNPVPVEAMFDDRVANQVTLSNLLQREGYESLDDVREQGVAEGQALGQAEGQRAALEKLMNQRFGSISPSVAETLARATEAELDVGLTRILEARSASDVLRRRS